MCPLKLALVCGLAVLILPEEKMIDDPSGPRSGSVHSVAVSAARKRLIREPAEERIQQLIDGYEDLEVIRVFHLAS